jgi:hypothetical protein
MEKLMTNWMQLKKNEEKASLQKNALKLQSCA